MSVHLSTNFCNDGAGAPACNNAQRVAGSASLRANLEAFAALLGDLHGVNLVIPDGLETDGASLKEFCGRLLEPSGSHPWVPVLRTLPARDRLSIAGSLFSFRKLLPTADPSVDDYVRQMSETGVGTTRAYRNFCKKKVKKIFKRGWDRTWREVVLSTTPGTNSCSGVSRGKGGARSNLLGDRTWFLRACMGLERDLNVSTVREVGIARKDGKARRVTTSPAESIVLKPLHDMIYSHISKEKWLLRGEAEPCKFEGFEFRKGEVFVSGDYESASDGLSIEVAETILTCILDSCSYVPKQVKRVALESLRCVLVGDTVTGLQRRGQLMGNFLCFPLLCLQNYLAFCYLAGGHYPVRVNGDDIVFRAPASVADRWCEGVQALGLRLSKGKTMRNRRFFSLNSTYFRSRTSNGVKGVPIVRATLLFKGVESADSISGRVRSIGKFYDTDRTTKLRIFLLRQLQREIRTTQRSVVRGLGIPATAYELSKAGLYSREVFYSNLPRESRPPAKVVARGAIPPGWVKWRPTLGVRTQLEDDPEFRKDLVRHCWNVSTVKITSDAYWRVVRDGTSPYKPRTKEWFVRRARLLQMSVGATRSYLQGKVAKVPVGGKSVWRRAERRT